MQRQTLGTVLRRPDPGACAAPARRARLHCKVRRFLMHFTLPSLRCRIQLPMSMRQGLGTAIGRGLKGCWPPPHYCSSTMKTMTTSTTNNLKVFHFRLYCSLSQSSIPVQAMGSQNGVFALNQLPSFMCPWAGQNLSGSVGNVFDEM